MAGRNDILLLDGAVGTELERRGVDVSLPLWSARALIDAPDAVEEIHRDYLEAGAQALVTNTFRTYRRSLDKAGLGNRCEELTRRAVELAQRARDAVNPEALILGSVAPLEDCYQPELAPPPEQCAPEHAELIGHLVDAGVDRILIETMATRHEAMTAVEQARMLAPGRWMISFYTKDDGPPGVLPMGTNLTDVLSSLVDAVAVGVNCLAAPGVKRQVSLLRKLLPEDVAVMAYANIGHADRDGVWVDSDAVSADRYADYALEWIEAGASIVGGCCGTTPATIRAIADRLAKRS